MWFCVICTPCLVHQPGLGAGQPALCPGWVAVLELCTLSHSDACSTCALTLAKSTPRKVTMTSWPCRVAFSVMLTGASGSGARGSVGCAGWLARLSLAVGLLASSSCRLGQLLRPSGNGSTQAMLAEAVRRLGEVLTVAVAVDDVVGCRAVALAGYLGRAIGQ